MKNTTLSAVSAAVMLAAGALAPAAAFAETKTNPVTGASETYENVFTGGAGGTATEWNSADNWDTSTTPFITTTYSPALVNGKTASTSAAIDGWTLRVGAYNGAAVTWAGGITKIQAGSAGCWLTADETSSITIASFAGNQLEGSDAYPFKLSSANAGGITWSAGLTSASNTSLPFWYYLKGTGTVVYGGDITVANAQVIKQADITLSGTSQVASKTLVTFGSGTTKTFTADATIKIKNSNGDVLKTVYLTSVTPGEKTITAENDVGTCEIVQTADGVVLYYVDGDPSEIKEYKPSININFTNGAGNGLTTQADVGLDGYAVPGTSWNNFVVANNATFNTVNAIDSTGAASVAAGVSVSISGTRGHYNCSNLTPASNLLHGYIDESSDGPTPTVTITGIPYEHYRVIVYHSTDQDGASFGYDTINGFNFTYVNGVQQTGTASWGSAGVQDSAEPIAEGVNTLVSAVLSGDTVTMVAHRIGGGTPTARGCFAAIQVVEYVPEVGENDLEIAVNGATEYQVNEEKTLSGTVYITGSGTLTLAGSEKITAATIDVAKDVVLNIDAARLDATTFTGAGTVVYDGAYPASGKGWTAIGWSGTVWVKNISNLVGSSFVMNDYGNNTSTLKVSMLKGWINTYNATDVAPALELDGDCEYALWLSNGNGYNSDNGNRTQLRELKGSGLLKGSDSGPQALLLVKKWDNFSGSFELKNKVVVFGSSLPTSASISGGGYVVVNSGSSVEIPSGKTWSVNNGFIVNGTLAATGSMAATTGSSSASLVKGTGTVVFNGSLPSPTGDAWWKNSAWDGTVQLANVNNLVGGTSWTGSNFLPNDYGNSESVLELKNCTGWLPNDANYQCTVPLKVSGTLTINNGISGNKFVISKLLGSGAIYTTDNGATTTIQVLNADGFTGYVNLNSKRVIFGETIPATFTAGQIYVGSGFSFTVPNSNAAWYGTGGILLDGELKATSLSNFGGGTTITTTDNGVFTFINSNNTYDTNVSYARITGTGTLRYENVSNKWRTLSKTDFPTGMICENNLATGLILETPGETYTIGSLAGSGTVRSDMSNGNRHLRILQATNTTYSGVFHSTDRIGTVTVAPGASSAGTLTLSNAQTVSNDLVVESGAAVNLTGTWIGATTVSGTFGGTGTLTGSLTFSAGSTFKAFASDENGLTVSGTVATPASGTVAVDVAEIASSIDSAGVTLFSAGSGDLDAAKFSVASGYRLAVEESGSQKLLKVYSVSYVAEYNGVQYETFAEAIAAAVAAGGTFADVTVLDASAVPEGYYKDANDRLAMYQAAVVDTDGTAHYYPTAQGAVDAVDSYLGIGGSAVYDYFAVYYGTGVPVAVNLSSMAWNAFSIKFKCYSGATVAVAPGSAEYRLDAGEPDADGIVVYEKVSVATTYLWAVTGSTAQSWGNPSHWKIGSADGDAATRAPSTLDTVVIDGGAPVNGAGGVTVAAIQVGGTAVVIGSGTLAATGAGIVLTDAAATLTVTGVTLSPAPSSGVEGYHVWTSSDGSSTVYSLAAADDATTVAVEGDNDTTYAIPRGWAVSHGIGSEAALAAAGANGIPAWQSYFLGLDPQDASSVVLCEGAPGAQTQDGEIALVAKNLLKPAGADGVAVTCRLQTWNGTEWVYAGSPVVAAAGQPVTLKYDASSGSAGFQRFRVAVTIAPAP